MLDQVIQVDQLGKKYRLQHQQRQRYAALRDVITSKFKTVVDRLSGRPLPAGGAEDFWAVRDVSFDVQQGDVVGIIGRNGAGKSTLLKLLSRITAPTEGCVRLHGRVASLLEVGTGFHPELSGRENIFLNGAILGMARSEIRRQFDAIVAFAEVERFLDTPVKHYSSGMYVRLAFAVAAHLEPEILIVDEVLAVGDAPFQKRCLNRMSEVASSGRTVLFVSHNMNAVERMCNRAIMLDRGKIKSQSSDVRAIINQYLGNDGVGEASGSVWTNNDGALDHRVMRPVYFAVVDEAGRPLTQPASNEQRLFVVIRAELRELDPAFNVGFSLFAQDTELLWSLSTDGPEHSWPKLDPGLVEFRCPLPARYLNEGSYRLEMIASLHCRDWFIRPGQNSPIVHFEIRGGLSDSPYWMFARPGMLAPVWIWERVASSS